jgi:hypothetical protein
MPSSQAEIPGDGVLYLGEFVTLQVMHRVRRPSAWRIA